ncbi:MAG TPA: response regulator [Methylococcaceae bacterium]|nr:response regulator [Methylococcaceae bacterium]
MHPTKSRILIVHENQTVAQNIANILAPADYTVLIALTGQFALDLFENNPQINIILCDSDLQSTEALKLSKQLLHYQTDQRPICIILLQEYSNPDLALLAFKAGVFDFLSHPTSPPYLLHCVNKAIQNIHYVVLPDLSSKSLGKACEVSPFPRSF